MQQNTSNDLCSMLSRTKERQNAKKKADNVLLLKQTIWNKASETDYQNIVYKKRV